MAYLFNKTGLLTFPPGTSEDKVMETALEAGVEDVVTDGDGTIEVLAAPEQLPVVVEAMKAAGLSRRFPRLSNARPISCRLPERTPRRC